MLLCSSLLFFITHTHTHTHTHIDGVRLVLELHVKRTRIRFISQNAVQDPLDVIAEVQVDFSFLVLTIKPSSCLTHPIPSAEGF